ncbi:MAG TPA: alpha-amylase family protein [Mucilaginibacter sp.]
MQRYSLHLLKAVVISMIITAFSCRQKEPPQAAVNTWYKNALIYNLDVKTFKDSDGDGRGDFKGLISKLDYLKELGVDMIWLAPFQPSPGEDDGYDVTDYINIDPRLGNFTDFQNFLNEAKKRHIKVIMDMILNHTSIQHPWYIEASHHPSSPKHNWYVWSTNRPSDWNEGMGFPGVEKETWRYDSSAHAYYFHRFYHFEPDLNFQNPQVIAEAEKTMGFWLDKGIDGFRLDAVPFIIGDPRKSTKKPEHDYSILHKLAGYVKVHYPSAILLGEANITADEDKKYFEGKDYGLQMMFNFYANQHLFSSLASGDERSLQKALDETRPKPAKAQWVYFLRNHDEVDLGRLSKNAREQINKQFGPDSSMQLYQRGIRRRLAPMLGDNMERLRMAYSLLFSLPGTPMLRYGEEIGMGDNLALPERIAVRTPMQWDTSANAGFSTALSPVRDMVRRGQYKYRIVNVQKEESTPGSLLNFIKKLITLHKQCPEIGYANWNIIKAGSDHVFAIRYEVNGKQLIIMHNFSSQPQNVKIDLGDKKRYLLTDLMTNQSFSSENISLSGYGYKWCRSTND